MEMDLFDFYNKCLVPLTPPASVNRIMELSMGAGETTEEITKLIALDPELQHWVRLTIQRMGFDRRVKGLDQMITLLGVNRVRDLLIGRTIERRYVPIDKTILAKLQSGTDAKKGAHTPAPKKAPANDSGGDPAAEGQSEEIIPGLADFQIYLACAKQAEEVAIGIRNSYPGQAFAGGLIFDFVKQYLITQDLSEVTDARLKASEKFLQAMFEDGLRCGICANEIIQKISIPHQKNVFVTALVHNIGKGLMLGYRPKDFEKAFNASSGADKEKVKPKKSEEAEEELFGFDHAQLGSIYVGRLPFLRELERSIDYHHAPHLLKFSDPGLYALSCILKVSAAFVKLYQKKRGETRDVEAIDDRSVTKNPEFEYLKLNEGEWREIKAQYALNLMKSQL